MLHKSQRLSRWLTAWMLFCFLAPQDVCLSCLVTRMLSVDRSTEMSCDSCVNVAGSDNSQYDHELPLRNPPDDSQCPNCIMKDIGVVPPSAVEIYRQIDTVSLFTCELEFEVVANRRSQVDSMLRPPAGLTEVFHLRI